MSALSQQMTTKKYNQEIPQLQTADKLVASRGRATQHSQDKNGISVLTLSHQNQLA